MDYLRTQRQACALHEFLTEYPMEQTHEVKLIYRTII